MDSAEPWTKRLRQRRNGGKPAETSTTVQQGSIARRKPTTRKKEAVKRAGKEKETRSTTPSRESTNANSRKRKASNVDNDPINPDNARESKRTSSPEPLPPTPTSETRPATGLREAQAKRNKRNLTISPSPILTSQTSLPTPSRTGVYFDRMTGPVTTSPDLLNVASPIEDESPTFQAAMTDSHDSILLSPIASNQENLQSPGTLNINVVENSRVERPFLSAPATASSSEESSRRHTAEQSQGQHPLEPAFQYISTRSSKDSQPPTTEELSPVGRVLEYEKSDNVPKAQEMERLVTLANLAGTTTASSMNDDSFDLHRIDSGLFLGSYIFILLKLI